MLTKAGAQIDWNADNERELSSEYRRKRLAQREAEGLGVPHGPERTLTPDQVAAVLDDELHLWRQYVHPRCDHLIHTEQR